MALSGIKTHVRQCQTVWGGGGGVRVEREARKERSVKGSSIDSRNATTDLHGERAAAGVKHSIPDEVETSEPAGVRLCKRTDRRGAHAFDLAPCSLPEKRTGHEQVDGSKVKFRS